VVLPTNLRPIVGSMQGQHGVGGWVDGWPIEAPHTTQTPQPEAAGSEQGSINGVRQDRLVKVIGNVLLLLVLGDYRVGLRLWPNTLALARGGW